MPDRAKSSCLCALKALRFWQRACRMSRHGASHYCICMHQTVLQSMVTLLKAAHVDDMWDARLACRLGVLWRRALLHGAGDVRDCAGPTMHIVKGRGQHLRVVHMGTCPETAGPFHAFSTDLLGFILVNVPEPVRSSSLCLTNTVLFASGNGTQAMGACY